MDTIILDNSTVETVIIKISEFPESSRKWADITDKPAVIAAGDTIQEALEQIGLENVPTDITSLQEFTTILNEDITDIKAEQIVQNTAIDLRATLEYVNEEIGNTVEYVNQGDQTNASAITAEAQRATTAEQNIANNLSTETTNRIAGDLNLVQKKPKLVGGDGFYYPDGYLSLDGTKILNNYDRFNGTPFNVTKVTTWFDGTTMNDSKVDNIIYFKNPVSLGGGYSKRDYDGGVDAKWFGAKGDGIADDTSALNLFASYIMSHKCGSAIMVGTFRITGKVSFISAGSPITGLYADCLIKGDYSSEEEMVLFQNWYNGKVTGHFEIIGKGNTDWVSRTNGIGLYVKDCSKMHFTKISVTYTKYDGVVADGQSYLFGVDQLTTQYCGSAVGLAVGRSVNILSNVNSGGQNDTEQRSTLTLNTIPIGVGYPDTFVKIGTRLHQIMTVDAPNNKVSVYPWIDSTLTFPQPMYIYRGAGLKVKGSDASCAKIGQHDALVCGIGILNQALYPASVDVFVSQHCGIGHLLAQGAGDASVGGAMLSSYWEANDFDFIVNTLYPVLGYSLVSTTAINLTKCLRIVPAISGTNPYEQYNNFEGINIGVSGKNYEDINNQSPNVGCTSIVINTANNADYNIKANSYTLLLKDNNFTKDIARLFRHRTFKINAIGTGTNGEPTGTYTFTPDAGYSINGGVVGANYVVSGMTSPTMFYGRLDGTNWTLYLDNFSNDAGGGIAIDLTATPYTKSTINVAYPSAKKRFIVIQDGANQTYIKKDNSPTGNWSTFPTVQLT